MMEWTSQPFSSVAPFLISNIPPTWSTLASSYIVPNHTQFGLGCSSSGGRNNSGCHNVGTRRGLVSRQNGRKHKLFSEHHKRKRKHNNTHRRGTLRNNEAKMSTVEPHLQPKLPTLDSHGVQYYQFFAMLLPSIEPNRQKLALESVALKRLSHKSSETSSISIPLKATINFIGSNDSLWESAIVFDDETASQEPYSPTQVSPSNWSTPRLVPFIRTIKSTKDLQPNEVLPALISQDIRRNNIEVRKNIKTQKLQSSMARSMDELKSGYHPDKHLPSESEGSPGDELGKLDVPGNADSRIEDSSALEDFLAHREFFHARALEDTQKQSMLSSQGQMNGFANLDRDARTYNSRNQNVDRTRPTDIWSGVLRSRHVDVVNFTLHHSVRGNERSQVREDGEIDAENANEINFNNKISQNSIPTLDPEEEEERLIFLKTKEEQITIPQKTQINDPIFPRKKGKHGEDSPGGEEDDEEAKKEWDRLGQLIVVVSMAALGTVGNIFAIAALITEASLRKAGNILLANLMVACLLVTAGVLPTDLIELLAGWTHPSPVCKPAWVLTILAAHTALLTLPCLAWENHARQHSTRPLPGGVLVAMVIASWCAAFSLTAAQWAGGFGPTHCVLSSGLATQASMTAVVGVPLVVIPLLMMVVVHSHTLLHTPSSVPANKRCSEEDSSEANIALKKTCPQKDLALVATNLAVGVITGGLWAGGVAVDWWGSSEGSLTWLPSIAASSCGFLYAVHRPFRDAYYQLFNYCCCKTTVSMARRGRSETPMELYAGYASTSTARSTTEHVRVHVLPPYNMYSQSKALPVAQYSSSKPSRSKDRRHKSTNKNEIYEL